MWDICCFVFYTGVYEEISYSLLFKGFNLLPLAEVMHMEDYSKPLPTGIYLAMFEVWVI